MTFVTRKTNIAFDEVNGNSVYFEHRSKSTHKDQDITIIKMLFYEVLIMQKVS